MKALAGALGAFLGDRVSTSPSVRGHHSEDEAFHSAVPDLVVSPSTVEEISRAVVTCAEFGCPVVAWGAGTSLEGNALTTEGGACLSLANMDRVLSIEPEDFTVTVQAGVRRLQLNQELKGTGLFFPIDPGADATLGGMAATRASGTNAVKYGTMRENVLSCTVVLADGRIIRTRTRAPKSAAGYDLTSLFVGSEGTLGIIADVTLRLHPLPEQTTAVVCVFEDISAAVEGVVLAIQTGLGVARIEFMDAPMMAAVNAFEKSSHREAPTLFVEFHGSRAWVDDQVIQFADIVASCKGDVLQIATTPEDRAVLWKARHNALYASRAMRPGTKVLITDVCVPISRLAECVMESRVDLDASALRSTIAGHVGDGNFHAFISVDPNAPGEIAEAEALHHRMGERAIRMGGTCTGEHGIGLGKRDLLRSELDEAVAVMQTLKRALDPAEILNPGKVFA
jgi:D-lactate dehydrogenase (cytochrome)